MEFSKEKFSKFVMDRPYLGQFKSEDAAENEKVFQHALDKAGCGDSYEIFIKTDTAGTIKDAKYITYGCGYAQATCCALIESIVSKNVGDLVKLSEKEVEGLIEGIMGEFPVHKKAYMFFAKELLEGVCNKALGRDELVKDTAVN
jgi:NifU-like protein involved in Fe-S cluster formation